MQDNIVLDVFFDSGKVKLLGYYCSPKNEKAAALLYQVKGLEVEHPVEPVNHTEFEQRYGVDSNGFWYVAELPVQDFQAICSGVQVEIKESQGERVPLNPCFLVNEEELECKVSSFLLGANKFVLQDNELTRALAYWLVLAEINTGALLSLKAVFIRLLSLLIVHLKPNGLLVPQRPPYIQLVRLAQRFWANEAGVYAFTLARLACAYHYDHELIQSLEEDEKGLEIGGIELRMVLVVLYLRRLIDCVKNKQQAEISACFVSDLFKQTMLNAPCADPFQSEMAEKMSVLCFVYHRVYHLSLGVAQLSFTEKEIPSLSRKLYIASLGLLKLQDVLFDEFVA